MTDISFDACTCGSVVVSDAQAVAELKANNERLRAALRGLLADFGYTLPTGTKDMIRAVLKDDSDD
jgi:hypothetical protein